MEIMLRVSVGGLMTVCVCAGFRQAG